MGSNGMVPMVTDSYDHNDTAGPKNQNKKKPPRDWRWSGHATGAGEQLTGTVAADFDFTGWPKRNTQAPTTQNDGPRIFGYALRILAQWTICSYYAAAMAAS
jgi:hypothetical protein